MKKATQPLSFQSAGCIFKNPRGISAGALIDQAGLKGTRIGEAEISDRHANFIVTYDGAKAKDVLALIDMARAKCRNCSESIWNSKSKSGKTPAPVWVTDQAEAAYKGCPALISAVAAPAHFKPALVPKLRLGTGFREAPLRQLGSRASKTCAPKQSLGARLQSPNRDHCRRTPAPDGMEAPADNARSTSFSFPVPTRAAESRPAGGRNVGRTRREPRKRPRRCSGIRSRMCRPRLPLLLALRLLCSRSLQVRCGAGRLGERIGCGTQG